METSDAIATASAIIAVSSLIVSIYQLTAAMKHNRQSVKPVLQIGSGFSRGHRAGLTLANCGLGPAVITGSRVELDGMDIGEYGEDTVNRIRGDARPRPSAITFQTGAVLPKDYDAILLAVDDFDPDLPRHRDFAQLIRHRLTITLRYESLHGGDQFEVTGPKNRKERADTGATSDSAP